MSLPSEKINDTYPTPIQKFYSGCNVFVTGATGFLGKALIEKLARSCPDIGTLYLLVRAKKGKGIQQRLDDLSDDAVFDRVKLECPNFRQKLVGIAGDCGLPGLGIGENDRRILCSEVSVVFHAAATVKFYEKLKLAIEINVRGTSVLLEMCAEMHKLKAVIHVSTAYSNCAEDVIGEIYYPVPIDGRKAILAAENFDDEILDVVTPKLFEKHPNTYLLTKAIAENVVKDAAGNLPICIFRPSIVVSSYKEPVAGWADNLYGPVGFTVGVGAGVIRTMCCNPKANANVVPIDMCVNGLIAVAWDVDRLYQESKRESAAYERPIYHYESSTDRPIYWETYLERSVTLGHKYPPMNAIWYCGMTLTKNVMLYILLRLLLHSIPALLADGALRCMGKKPRFLNLYKKIHQFTGVLTYFGTRTFTFASRRMRNLISNMSPQDQATFFCDLKLLEWDEYFKTYFRGVRVYLMKDPLSTLDAARRKWNRLYWLHQGCKLLLSVVALWISWFVVISIMHRWAGVTSWNDDNHNVNNMNNMKYPLWSEISDRFESDQELFTYPHLLQ